MKSFNTLTISILIALGVVSIATFIACTRPDKTEREGMVLIPAGEFMMGTSGKEKQALIDIGLWKDMYNNELPEHPVYLDAFYIDKYEVTNAQYAEFLNAYGQNIDVMGDVVFDIGRGLIEKGEISISRKQDTKTIPLSTSVGTALRLMRNFMTNACLPKPSGKKLLAVG